MFCVYIATLLMMCGLAFGLACSPQLLQTGPSNVKITSAGLMSGCTVNAIPYTTVYSMFTSYSFLMTGVKTGPASILIQDIEYTTYLNISTTFISATTTDSANFTGTLSIHEYPLCGGALWQTEFPPITMSDVTTEVCSEDCNVNSGNDQVKKFVARIIAPLSAIASVSIGSPVVFKTYIAVTAIGARFAAIGISLSNSSFVNNYAFTEPGNICQTDLPSAAEGCTTTESQTKTMTESPSQSQTSSPSQSPSESPSESHSPPPSHTNSNSESQAASNSNSESNSATAAIVNDVEHRLTGIELMATVMAALIVFAAVMSCPMMFA